MTGDRISVSQAIIAAIYASPFMATVLVLVRNNWANQAGIWKNLVGPVIGNALMLWVPTIAANLAALMLVRWLGSGLDNQRFHLMIGLVSGGLLILLIDRISRSTLQFGGGPLLQQTVIALAIAGICNAGMIWAVWRLGWKSNFD